MDTGKASKSTSKFSHVFYTTNRLIMKIKQTDFYRVPRITGMHSADYAVARCLSVRLSVTRRYSV